MSKYTVMAREMSACSSNNIPSIRDDNVTADEPQGRVKSIHKACYKCNTSCLLCSQIEPNKWCHPHLSLWSIYLTLCHVGLFYLERSHTTHSFLKAAVIPVFCHSGSLPIQTTAPKILPHSNQLTKRTTVKLIFGVWQSLKACGHSPEMIGKEKVLLDVLILTACKGKSHFTLWSSERWVKMSPPYSSQHNL